MLNISQLPDNVNITVTKEDLFEVVNICLLKNQHGQRKAIPEHLTIKQLAEYISYSEPAIYKMVADASIPCYRLAGKLLFRRSEIDDWLFNFRQATISERISELDSKRK